MQQKKYLFSLFSSQHSRNYFTTKVTHQVAQNRKKICELDVIAHCNTRHQKSTHFSTSLQHVRVLDWLISYGLFFCKQLRQFSQWVMIKKKKKRVMFLLTFWENCFWNCCNFPSRFQERKAVSKTSIQVTSTFQICQNVTWTPSRTKVMYKKIQIDQNPPSNKWRSSLNNWEDIQGTDLS